MYHLAPRTDVTCPSARKKGHTVIGGWKESAMQALTNRGHRDKVGLVFVLLQ